MINMLNLFHKRRETLSEKLPFYSRKYTKIMLKITSLHSTIGYI